MGKMKKMIVIALLSFLFLSCESNPNHQDYICYVCGGSGNCYKCNGRGYSGIEKCPVCNGSGKCINCNGAGRITRRVIESHSMPVSF
jgi:DnaJ-class molecular chaperone